MRNCIIIPSFNNFKNQLPYGILSWEYYGKKHNIDVIIPNKPTPDSPAGNSGELGAWAKWDGVNDIIEDYDNFLMVDADTMVRWDSPNIFQTIKINSFNAVLDGKAGYWHFPQWRDLDNFSPNLDLYFNTGLQSFSKEIGKSIIKNLPIYFDFWGKRHLNNIRIDAFEQTAINLIIQKLKIPTNLLSTRFNNLVLNNYDDFSFVNENYIWHFTGPRMGGWSNKANLMEQLWSQIKQYYI